MVNVSVGIPLFNKVTKARIRASRVQEEAAKLQTLAASASFTFEKKKAAEEFRKRQQQLLVHESSGLSRAALLVQHANLAFKNGEIGYLEWSVLMNQAAQLQLNYADALAGYNKALIELEYLTGKITP